jgi:hypothetical protein
MPQDEPTSELSGPPGDGASGTPSKAEMRPSITDALVALAIATMARRRWNSFRRRNKKVKDVPSQAEGKV